jgi:hypothetical protein
MRDSLKIAREHEQRILLKEAFPVFMLLFLIGPPMVPWLNILALLESQRLRMPEI